MQPAARAPPATCWSRALNSGLPTPRRAFALQVIKQGRQRVVGAGGVLEVRGQRPEARLRSPTHSLCCQGLRGKPSAGRAARRRV